MSRAITSIAYIWLLSVEFWEDLVYSVRERFPKRSSVEAETRTWQPGDHLMVLPPTAVH